MPVNYKEILFTCQPIWRLLNKCRFPPQKTFWINKKAIISFRRTKNKSFRFRKSGTAIFLVSFKIFFKRKIRVFSKSLTVQSTVKNIFPKIMTVFPQKNKQPLFWINICSRPVKLISISAGLWKLDICIVFCRYICFFPFLRFVFVRNCFLFAIFDNAAYLVAHSTNIKLTTKQ